MAKLALWRRPEPEWMSRQNVAVVSLWPVAAADMLPAGLRRRRRRDRDRWNPHVLSLRQSTQRGGPKTSPLRGDTIVFRRSAKEKSGRREA